MTTAPVMTRHNQRMPSPYETPRRTFRISADLSRRAQAAADARGETLTAAVTRFLDAYATTPPGHDTVTTHPTTEPDPDPLTAVTAAVTARGPAPPVPGHPANIAVHDAIRRARDHGHPVNAIAAAAGVSAARIRKILNPGKDVT